MAKLLSGFSVALKFVYIIPVITIVWSIIIGGPVTDLNLNVPFTSLSLDLQTPTEYIASMVNFIEVVLPPLAHVIKLIIYAIIIKFFLMIITFIILPLINLLFR